MGEVANIKPGFLFKNGNYEVLKQIGEGGFGIIYLVKDNYDENEPNHAIKMLRDMIFTENETIEYLNEIECLTKYRNIYILNYVEHFLDNNRPCIVTTYYKDGDLDGLIQKYKVENRKFKPEEILFYLYQILNGLDYLHSKKIVHRDLKPKNIFLNEGWLVIGDLGLAKRFDQIRTSSQFAGSINYLSPECIDTKQGKENIRSSLDIWSLGCILYELVELKKAFSGENDFQVMNKIVNCEIPEISDEFFEPMFLK